MLWYEGIMWEKVSGSLFLVDICKIEIFHSVYCQFKPNPKNQFLVNFSPQQCNMILKLQRNSSKDILNSHLSNLHF